MMTQTDIRDLYQEVILDHNKSPRNYGKLDVHTHHAEGYNPLCGDHLQMYLKIDNDMITEVRFEGEGCAISKATASLMTTELKGKTTKDAQLLFDKFLDVVTSEITTPIDPTLGKLSVIAGVREFPVRIKCATLAMHTLKNAMQSNGTVSTE